MIKYQLKIHRQGVYRYLMSDMAFWNIRLCPHLEPHQFASKKSAELFYQRWARRYPAAANDWIPVIEEIEDQEEHET